MFVSRQNIKLSFDRARFDTKGNKVTCTLRYTIQIPRFSQYDSIFDPEGISADAHVEQNHFFIATGVAACKSGDLFDKKAGREIAEARAEAAAYKHARSILKKTVKQIADGYAAAFAAFDEKATAVRKHNTVYAASVGGYEPDLTEFEPAEAATKA